MKVSATETMKLVLQAQKPLLLETLRVPAPVRNSEDYLGINVNWDILQGIDSARDYETGLRINLDQDMFPSTVDLMLPNMDNTLKETITVQGTIGDVFRQIASSYYKKEQEYALLSFEGIYMKSHEGDEIEYYLEIEVLKDFCSTPFSVRY